MNKTPMMMIAIVAIFTSCETTVTKTTANEEDKQEVYASLGFKSKEAWGEHLVIVSGCDDCHSPKVMTDRGPQVNADLRLSGHPATSPLMDFDYSQLTSRGYAVCNGDLTAWVGPWGTSYAANITSDGTGIGAWTEDNFKRAMREGKLKGSEFGRQLLPPMPWPNFAKFSDDELSAIFAFLKSVPAVSNVPPNPQPPMAAN